MKYRPEDLRHLQEVEIEILQEIIRVCEENHISYFTYAGTTLGLIRHQGFIPWDDDIDLGMMREDYNRFLKIAPKALKQGYFLQHYSTEPNSPTYHAKVRKDGTKFVEKYCKDINMHKGIFVDIMPFDYAPDNKKEREVYAKKVRRARNLFVSKCTPKVTMEKNKYKRALKQMLRSIVHICLIPISKKYLFERLEKIVQRYDSSPTKTIGTRGIAVDFYAYDDVFPLVNRRFENIEVSSPHNAEAVLAAGFGDWQQLPPKEKRYMHAPIELSF